MPPETDNPTNLAPDQTADDPYAAFAKAMEGEDAGDEETGEPADDATPGGDDGAAVPDPEDEDARVSSWLKSEMGDEPKPEQPETPDPTPQPADETADWSDTPPEAPSLADDLDATIKGIRGDIEDLQHEIGSSGAKALTRLVDVIEQQIAKPVQALTARAKWQDKGAQVIRKAQERHAEQADLDYIRSLELDAKRYGTKGKATDAQAAEARKVRTLAVKIMQGAARDKADFTPEQAIRAAHKIVSGDRPAGEKQRVDALRATTARRTPAGHTTTSTRIGSAATKPTSPAPRAEDADEAERREFRRLMKA